METQKLSKARAGVFLLLIAISLYSLFMISASNTSYAAGQSLFKFSSLIGLSPSANSYDRQRFVNNVSENLISSTEDIKVPRINTRVRGMASFDEGEVASFLTSPRKSKFRRIVAAGANDNDKNSGLSAGLLLLPFNNSSASLDTGLISQCIDSIAQDIDTGERDIDAVIACIFNNGAGVLADGSNNGGTGNPVDPFDNNDPNGNGVNGNGGPNGNGNNGNGGPDGNGNNGNGVNVLAVPEPSTYLLLGLGMITLVGFSRKKASARIS